jgi:uncharacterized protein
MYKTLAHIVTSFPKLTICAVACFVALAGLGLPKLQKGGTGDSGYPSNAPLSLMMWQVRDIFPGENTLVFSISGTDRLAQIESGCRLVSLLESKPEVIRGSVAGATASSTKYITSLDGYIQAGDMSEACGGFGAESFGQLLAQTGPQQAYLSGRAGELFVYADVKVDAGLISDFVGTLELETNKLVAPGTEIQIAGSPVFLAALQTYSARMGIFFPIIIIVIALLHWEAMRSLQAVLIPLLTGLLATISAFGVAGWLNMAVDEYTSTAPVLIVAVAAGHSVQLLKRYLEELGKVSNGCSTREENRQALKTTIISVGPVLTVAVLAASFCLFALLALDVPAIGQFGFVAGIGLCCALVLELTFIPALRLVIPSPVVSPKTGKLAPRWEGILGHVSNVSQSMRAPVLAAAICMGIVLLVAGASLVKPSHSLTTSFSPSTPERLSLAALQTSGLGPFPLDVMIDAGESDAAFSPELLNMSERLAGRLAERESVVATSSPGELISFLKCRFSELEDCSNARVESSEEAFQLWTILYGSDASSLIDPSGRYLRIRSFLNSDETGEITALIDEVSAFARQNDLTVAFGGAAVQPKALADGILAASIEKVFLILGIVALTGLIVFRSLLAALLFLIPSSITALSAYAFLGWTGIPLNVATASIAALSVGIGVDYLVYLTFRLREELRGGGTWEASIRSAMMSAGGASVCVATAVAGGYLVLLASPGFRVHQWLGMLIPLSMASSLIGALVIYPFALRLLKPTYLRDGKFDSSAAAPSLLSQS